ncbi:MAG: hypothetical protein H6751_10965 [Candidatus Omnitrophica bacterium]|nr:hypothetical protein [Candidatus Omnitrophota bacterium]MCB9783471.1 hypothetical protein [Candidatus Omnitrophota bacterium]
MTRLTRKLAPLVLFAMLGCATPGLMKQWERQEQRAVESENFVVYLDDQIPRAVGREVLDSLEFAREKVGKSVGFYSDEKIVCNLYQNEKNLRNVSVGLPLGFFIPRRAPLAYVLGGEVHGRLYCTPCGNVSRLWVSTFPHEYCHIMFKELTGRQYFQYSWLQEGLGEYFRRLYLQEKVEIEDLRPDRPEILTASYTDVEQQDPLYLHDSKTGVWSFTDWEVRNAVRYDKLVPLEKLAPATFFGYWQKFNTPEANQIYAISSSAVEFLVTKYGWNKMRELLDGIRDTRSLDKNLENVYGFDQEGLDSRWRDWLEEKWPEPWQPEIEMVYLVRGNWEIDGHEAGIRTGLADRDAESVQRHQRYLLSRSVTGMDPAYILPVMHSGGFPGEPPGPGDGLPADPLAEPVFLHTRDGSENNPPVLEHYDAAMAEYSVGNFTKGVEHLLTVLEEEPEQASHIRPHLARGLWVIGQRERALSLYEEELAENDDPAFVNEVAWCCERTGHYDRAVELYEDIEDRTDIPKLKQHAINRIDQIQYHLNRQKDSNRGAVTYAY